MFFAYFQRSYLNSMIFCIFIFIFFNFIEVRLKKVNDFLAILMNLVILQSWWNFMNFVHFMKLAECHEFWSINKVGKIS